MAGNVASQISAITSMNLRNVAERATSSVVALVGIAGVVTVLIGVLSIAAGFRAVLDQSGQADVAIILRSGATDEMGSSLANAQTRIIADASEAARDAGVAKEVTFCERPRGARVARPARDERRDRHSTGG